MIRYVIDASVAAEYLLRTPLGLQIAPLIEQAFLLAPELLDVEVVSVLRRAVLRRKLEEHRAMLAMEDLIDWQVDRIAHTALVREAWQHRHNVSAYDAFYVAVARIYAVPLPHCRWPSDTRSCLGHCCAKYSGEIMREQSKGSNSFDCTTPPTCTKPPSYPTRLCGDAPRTGAVSSWPWWHGDIWSHHAGSRLCE